MMHPIKTRRALFSVSALLGLAAFGLARPVEAEPTYPPRLQAGLEAYFHQSFCVPQCIVCHQTNAGGGPTTAFGTSLIVKGGLTGLVDDPVADKVAKYFDAVKNNQMTGGMPNGDSDGDGISDEDELKAGDLPGVAGPAGQNLLCADIKYGCAGGRIAAAPPVDNLGLLSAGLVVVGFAVMRRRRRPPKRAH